MIGTEPSEGESVPISTRVDLVVSTGHAPTGVVPDVSGADFDGAVQILARDGYTASRIDQASSTLEFGIVLGSSPPAGTPLTPGANVSVIVSSGWAIGPTEPPTRPPEFLGPR